MNAYVSQSVAHGMIAYPKLYACNSVKHYLVDISYAPYYGPYSLIINKGITKLKFRVSRLIIISQEAEDLDDTRI